MEEIEKINLIEEIRLLLFYNKNIPNRLINDLLELIPTESDLEEKVDDLEEKVDDLEEKVDDLEREIEQLKEKIDELENN